MQIVRSDMLADMEFGELTLASPYGDLLGPIERKTGVFVWGPEGSGKSTFCLGLARALVPHALVAGGTVLYASREEGPDRKTRDRQKRLDAEHPALLISDFTSIENLKKAIDEYGVEFVVIDSVSALNIGSAKAEQLINWLQERGTGIICVAHANARGHYKGQTDLPHMLDVVVKCYPHPSQPQTHVAETTKNRYKELTAIRIPMTADGIGDDPPMDTVRRENPDCSETPQTAQCKAIFAELEQSGRYRPEKAKSDSKESDQNDKRSKEEKEATTDSDREDERRSETSGSDQSRSASSSIDVQDVPLSLIETDEERFQPRGGAFSEETAHSIAEDFDPELMDPIDLWLDEDDGNLYVLAGHSRLEGFRRRGAETIPAVIKDFSEKQAIRYALVENDKGTSLTNAERAGVIRRLRESGELDTIQKQRDFAEKLYDRNARVVFDLSWLDPRGKALDVLRSLEGSAGSDYKDAETMAQWVGKMMRLHRADFGRKQENEMFNFLLDNYKTKGRRFTAFPAFRNFVEEAKNREAPIGSFDESMSLNLNQIRPKSQQETEIDRQLQEAREEVREARKALESKREELIERRAGGEDVTDDDFDRVLRPFEQRLRRAQQDLIQARREAQDARQTVRQTQTSLLDAIRENPERAIELVGGRDLVFLGFCTLVVTSEARFSGEDFLFSTPELDRLVVVPSDQVEVADGDLPHDDAETAYERWHRFAPAGTDFELDLDLSDPRPAGTARRIEYGSDKIVRPGDEPGTWNEYYHEFTDEHLVVRLGDALVIAPGGTLKINQDGLLGIVN